MSRNVAQILYDGYGNAVAIRQGDAILPVQPGFLVFGQDENGDASSVSVSSGGSLSVANVGQREIVGEYYFGSSLIIGAGASQNLVSLENPVGSGRNIYLNKTISNGVINARFTSTFLYRISRTSSLPTGGVVQIAQLRNSSDVSPIGVVRVSPTATAAAGSLWTGSPGVLTPDGAHNIRLEAIATFEERKEIILAPGEGLVVIADSNSPDWDHWVNLHWNEVAI